MLLFLDQNSDVAIGGNNSRIHAQLFAPQIFFTSLSLFFSFSWSNRKRLQQRRKLFETAISRFESLIGASFEHVNTCLACEAFCFGSGVQARRRARCPGNWVMSMRLPAPYQVILCVTVCQVGVPFTVIAAVYACTPSFRLRSAVESGPGSGRESQPGSRLPGSNNNYYCHVNITIYSHCTGHKVFVPLPCRSR